MNSNKYIDKNTKGEITLKVKDTTIAKTQIDEWKAEFGHVYRTMNGDDPIIYRPIRRSEYTKLMLETDISEEDEEVVEKRIERTENRRTAICSAATLFPEDIEKVLENQAGLAASLAEEIMAHSGFMPLQQSEEL